VLDHRRQVALGDEGELRGGRERVSHVLAMRRRSRAAARACRPAVRGGRRVAPPVARCSRGALHVVGGDRPPGPLPRRPRAPPELLRELAHRGSRLHPRAGAGAAARGAGAGPPAGVPAPAGAPRRRAAVVPATSMLTITVPTGTMTPSSACTAAIRRCGRGISTLALSVMTSTSGWSRSPPRPASRASARSRLPRRPRRCPEPHLVDHGTSSVDELETPDLDLAFDQALAARAQLAVFRRAPP